MGEGVYSSFGGAKGVTEKIDRRERQAIGVDGFMERHNNQPKIGRIEEIMCELHRFSHQTRGQKN